MTTKLTEISPKTGKPKRKYNYKKKPNGKNETGRPTEYDTKYKDLLIEYFDRDPISKDLKPSRLPTIVGFSRTIPPSLASIYNWLDKTHASFQSEFLDAFLKIAKPCQADFLIQSALTGLYNSNFAKFLAVNITDMKESKGIEIPDSEEIDSIKISFHRDKK